MHLGIDFFFDFGRFWGGKWSQVLAPKSHPTCGFLKIRKMPCGASPLAPNEVRGVQVGSENRLKSDRNLKSKIERLLASFFRGFWRFWGSKLGRKIEPRSTKNRCQKSIEKMMRKRGPPGAHGRGKPFGVDTNSIPTRSVLGVPQMYLRGLQAKGRPVRGRYLRGGYLKASQLALVTPSCRRTVADINI